MNNWLVPIVLKDELYRDIVPKNSYIAVDKFSNMKALADYLQYLQQNKTAYREYFRWRQTHKIIDPYTRDFHFGKSNAYCDLCEKVGRTLNLPAPPIDIPKWYNSEGICTVMPDPI
jgi:hypothetical protein